MQKFSEQFQKIDYCKGKIILEHILFDKQIHYCDEIHIIDDEHRIGLILKNQEIFVDKQRVALMYIQANTFMISDNKLSIKIILNKL